MVNLGRFRSQLTRRLAEMLLLVLAGCAGREVAGTFSTDPAPPFSASGTRMVPSRWWTEFDDSTLNAQINQALEDNFTLAAALQRLYAARALARREASDLWPDVNGVIDVESSFGPGEDVTGSVFGLDAAYQVDLWGQIESRVEALQLEAAATHADYHTVALTLSAEIARTWFSLIESQAQLALLDEQIETNRNGLTALESRFGQGLIRSADVYRQRQLVEATLEQVVVTRSRIEVLEHQLAVLLGQAPQETDYDPGVELPELPPLPETGLPSELVMRRPDVRREYLAFLAADRGLAAAITAQYPRLSLTGSVLNIADSPENLFRDWFVSIGSQLIAPLIDGGQREAEVVRTAAVLRERFNNYGQAMLVAFREVEDALARERLQLERLENLDAQVELARKASNQLRELYLIGDTDFLSVLTSITSQQRLQRERLSARLELVLIRIELYLALAGDFVPQPDYFESVEFPAVLPPEPEILPEPEELPPDPPVELLPEPVQLSPDAAELTPEIVSNE